MINIPTVVYRKLLERIEAKIEGILKESEEFKDQNIHTIKRLELWRNFIGRPEAEVLFASGIGRTKSNIYFLRRINLETDDEHINTFHEKAFTDALNFIGGYYPAGIKYDTKTKSKEWGDAFLELYFKERHKHYYDTLFSKKPKVKVLTTSSEKDDIQLFNERIFIAEQTQGQLKDRVVARLKIHADNSVSGTFEVLYQEPNFDYHEDTMILSISGKFFGGKILALNFVNQKLENHNGVYLGEIMPWVDKIRGRYIVHFPGRPAIRETDISSIIFRMCKDEATAQKFLDDWRGKKADQNAVKARIARWKVKHKLEQEAQEFLKELKKNDRLDNTVKEFIKQCRLKQADY